MESLKVYRHNYTGNKIGYSCNRDNGIETEKTLAHSSEWEEILKAWVTGYPGSVYEFEDGLYQCHARPIETPAPPERVGEVGYCWGSNDDGFYRVSYQVDSDGIGHRVVTQNGEEVERDSWPAGCWNLGPNGGASYGGSSLYGKEGREDGVDYYLEPVQ